MVNDTKERIPDAAAGRVIACYEARSGSPKHLPCPWDKVAPDILPAGVAALCRDGLFPWPNFGRQMGGEPPRSRSPWALSGVWDRERVHRQEGDERRYKGRCRFYEYKDNWCKMRIGQCVGSAHCERYEAVSEEEFRHRQSARQRHKKNQPTKDDECYWY